jgi:hypothetical protein
LGEERRPPKLRVIAYRLHAGPDDGSRFIDNPSPNAICERYRNATTSILQSANRQLDDIYQVSSWQLSNPDQMSPGKACFR